MKLLIISDIHLKPKLFEKADKILSSGQADTAIQMGDLTDDWGEGYNIGLYERTLRRAIIFKEDHPDSLWLAGNHDIGYLYSEYGPKESGHSKMAEPFVKPLLEQLSQKIMYIVDGCIFTHAGLTNEWLDRQKLLVGYNMNDYGPLEEPDLEKLVNYAPVDELWQENSPIWARPQIDEYVMCPAKLQVVGHTPVKAANDTNNVLSTDTHSTYRNGAPYGDCGFVIVDTMTGDWKDVKEVE